MCVKFSREYYGWDRFSKVTLVVGIFLFVTGYGWILGSALIVYSIWRSKSTNTPVRNKEKVIFETIERNFYNKISKFRQDTMFKKIKIKKYGPIERLKQKRKYIITSCPKCTQKLRLPRGKGKIIVTCTKCCSEFRLKT